MSAANPPRLLVLGATSGIAEGVIRECAARHWRLHLVARAAERLMAVAADAVVRGAEVTSDVCDLGELKGHSEMVERAWTALGGAPEHILVAVGSMPDETNLAGNPAVLAEIVAANLTVPAALVEALLKRLQSTRTSSIGVLASVAGDRPRGRMAAYGGAKAGIAGYLSGVRHRLAGQGPRIIIIKPGPVRTSMTAGLISAGPMLAPEVAGRLILRALQRAEGVVYVPGFFRVVMMIIRALPEFLFWRMRM